MSTARRDLLEAHVARAKRIHREVADLYPRVKQISNSLSRARRRHESDSPDLTEAGRIDESLDELMAACADAIVAGRRR